MSYVKSILVGLSLLMIAGVARPVIAQTEDDSVGVDGLSVRVYSKWVGGREGGYFPIRIQIVNTGESRELTFKLEPVIKKEKMPVVKKTIRADRNATLQFTLSVPLVGNGNQAYLKVLDENGDEIERLFQRIELPDRSPFNTHSPSVLIISDVVVNATRLETAVRSIAAQQHGHPPHHHMHHAGAGQGLNHASISASMLPESWIDYTSVDIVVADLNELMLLNTARRTAILKWVQCGGTLLVRNINERPQTSKTLNRTLQISENSDRQLSWRSADISVIDDARGVNIVNATPGIPNIRTGRPGFPRSMPTPVRPIRTFGRFTWPPSGRAFAVHDEKLGMIVAFRNDPFDGSTRDWIWLLKVLKPAHYDWVARHGMSARRDTGEFLNFLIPGVKGVPVYAFLFLMTVFTLIIGPLNYLILWKRKQLFLLVLTIPIVAFVTSLSLFGYSAISHGFAVKSRVRSLTVLDQRDQTAVTTSRIALFAGIAPSEGLQFSADTAVYPVWPHSNEFETGVVDWTDSQSMQAGWLRSRTRTQFLTTQHHKERGRLEINFAKDGRSVVVNGFETDIELLLINDHKGRLHSAQDLAAGQSKALQQADKKAVRNFALRIKKDVPRPPENLTEYRDSSIFNIRRRVHRNFYGYGKANTKVAFSSALMEQRISQVVDHTTGKSTLPPNSYVAILRSNPRVSVGVSGTEEAEGFHLLIGSY